MKNHSKIIGLTGGIATGKSTVTKLIRKSGHPVICADEIAHDVVKQGKPSYKKVIKLFGKDILQKNKQLNRQKIAKLVFTQPKLKRKLEAIIHPEVRKEMNRKIKYYITKKKPLIFLDVPLLFESKMAKMCHKTICIATTLKLQIERLKRDRNMARKHALDRIRSQMPLREKINKADYVIWNKGTIRELSSRLKRFLINLTA